MPVASILVLALLAAASEWVLNPDLAHLASLPSFAVHPGGATTFVWSAYSRGQERVFARSEGGVVRLLSPGPGIYCQPRFVATGDGSGWAFWTRQRLGRFEIAGRRLDGGEWEPLVTLGADAMLPAALATRGTVVLAFEDHVRPQRIQVRAWDGNAWSPPVVVTQETLPAYRPALAASGDGRVWAFWDAYLEAERGYAVFARQVLPERGPIERLSPPGKSCLKPSRSTLAGPASPPRGWLPKT